MLILTRKAGQQVLLEVAGRQLAVITVIQVRPGSVRLGIDAPPAVKVRRDDAKQLEKSPKRRARESA